MPSTHRRGNLIRLLALLTIMGFLIVVLYLLTQGYELGSLPGDAYLAVADYSLYFPTTSIVILSMIFNLTAYLVYSLVRHHLHMVYDHVAWEKRT